MRRLFSVICISLLSLSSVAAGPSYPSTSLYNLHVRLVDAAGQVHGMDIYRGRPVLVTMFYGSCPMACPLLIDTVRAVERSVPPDQRKHVRVLMISIDPERDTPAALGKLAQERRIDVSRWTLAQTDDRAVRKIAALLNIQFRKLPSGGFNHASIITLLDAQGSIQMQSSTIGKADPELVFALGRIAATRDAAP